MSSDEQRDAGSTTAQLSRQVGELGERIEALREEIRRLGPVPSLPGPQPGWDDAQTPASHAWVTDLGASVRRRPTAPRLLLECLFLVATAVAAGLADLDAAPIAAVLAGAWVLVALIEWTAARAERRRDSLALIPPPAPRTPVPADPSWFVPPVEQTMLETPAESDTVISRLPPPRDD